MPTQPIDIYSYIIERQIMTKIAKYLRHGSFAIAFIMISALVITLTGTQPHVATAQISGGPALPYSELQAEDATTNGTHIDARNNRFYPGLANEAIGRQAITLSAQGQYVEFIT